MWLNLYLNVWKLVICTFNCNHNYSQITLLLSHYIRNSQQKLYTRIQSLCSFLDAFNHKYTLCNCRFKKAELSLSVGSSFKKKLQYFRGFFFWLLTKPPPSFIYLFFPPKALTSLLICFWSFDQTQKQKNKSLKAASAPRKADVYKIHQSGLNPLKATYFGFF